MRDHKKLRAFELADDLAVAIYGATRTFPHEERFLEEASRHELSDLCVETSKVLNALLRSLRAP